LRRLLLAVHTLELKPLVLTSKETMELLHVGMFPVPQIQLLASIKLVLITLLPQLTRIVIVSFLRQAEPQILSA
jgi:hypothetical protein